MKSEVLDSLFLTASTICVLMGTAFSGEESNVGDQTLSIMEMFSLAPSNITSPSPPPPIAPAVRPRASNRIDNDACIRENIDCSVIFGHYCCRDGLGYVRCCTTNNIQPSYKNPSGDPHWFHRFSLWNMWYFWFMVVLIMATCFTGCNYWRRQRRPQNFRLFQRQYTTIGGNAARGGVNSSGGHHRQSSSSQQVVIPITMYEISPDTILSLMRENALDRSGSSAGSSPHHHVHGRHHACRRHHLSNQQQDTNIVQHHGPPSYCEVTSKPNKYPPKVDDSDLPTYEAVSKSMQQPRQEGQGASSGGASGESAPAEQRCSSL